MNLTLHANKLALIDETDFRNLPDDVRGLVKVGMGGAALKDLLDKIDLKQLIADLTTEAEDAKGQRKKKLLKRLRLLESMERAGIEPGSTCVSVLPVIPPDLRPMVQLTGGRFATSDLNDLYRRVINRNNRLKKLIDLNAPEVIRRNEQRMLQEAVDALIDNNSARSGRAVAATGQRRRLKSLSDMLKGKQAVFARTYLANVSTTWSLGHRGRRYDRRLAELLAEGVGARPGLGAGRGREDELDERHLRHRVEDVQAAETLGAAAGGGELADRQRRGGRGDDGVVGGDCARFGEDRRLGGERRGDRLDDEGDLGELGEVGDDADVCPAARRACAV